MQAMILAAGFGTRLLPYSAERPKPLFPILNTPLLLITIERLRRVGCTKIIVNCHHLAAQIVDAVKDIEGVIVQEEETILGTGGGLAKARVSGLINDEPLLVTNGDIYHNIDLVELYQVHSQHGFPITMAVHNYPRFNSLQTKNKCIVGFGYKGEGSLAFTGLHVIDPKILDDIAEGFSCIIDKYKALLQSGETLVGHRVDDFFWTDMGTPKDYLDLHAGLIGGSIPLPEQAGAGIYRNGELKGAVKDWACLAENVTLPSGAIVARSVIWDGVKLEAQLYEDKIVSPKILGQLR